jgi:thymidylate synthase (FAD)
MQMSLIPELPHDYLELPFPAKHARVFETGTPGACYLQEPGVVLLAKPEFSRLPLREFFEGFDAALQFPEYLQDTGLPPAEELCKFAGQLCYLSFGPGRTKNAEASRYLRNILESGHHSVLEHAQFTFLFYGISRSLTHELVRHRAGWAYSQVSQRYVDGSRLRFVERPEFARNEELHEAFLWRIEDVTAQYEALASQLMREQEQFAKLSGLSRTDLRKRVNQVARALLPNETEAPIVASANARAWRHFLTMRGSIHAETEIRRLAVEVSRILRAACIGGALFQDVEEVEKAGEICLHLEFSKV